MSETKLHRLAELGQSVWLDYIRRSLITSGGLEDYVDQGLRGVTSNPAIFQQAIAKSNDHDQDLERLAQQGKSAEEIYEVLAVEDIRRAADVLRPVFQATQGMDGLVSLEVNPHLAHDTKGTVEEARRLFAAVDRPNVMIKVPATFEGLPAVKALIGEGININVTLIFSLGQYDAVADAYMGGLERLLDNGQDLAGVASVASFFVSRIDVMVDGMLDELGLAMAQDLKGKIGIANSKIAYQHFKDIFHGDRWERLAAHGARVQRVLYGSTSTKNPAYSDVLYVENLIGPQTVNTVPPETLEAFLDHGTVSLTLEKDLDAARAALEQLAALGIDLDAVTDRLLTEGVDKFSKPFDSLMETITRAREGVQAGGQRLQAPKRSYAEMVELALEEMQEQEIIRRIWALDHTVWQPEPAGITDRLGWLHLPTAMRENREEIEAFAQSVRDEGYTDVLLLGMGGSSLAPEMFGLVFGYQDCCPDLEVLDSTDPGAVRAHAERLDPARTLFIVSSKSGTTTETLSLFRFFYNWTVGVLGTLDVGSHFVAITDPGSPLVELAKQYNFRATFLNPSDVGGRYSALSYFGLVPAALVGVDLARLLDSAAAMHDACQPGVPLAENPAARLGATMGELAKAGRDKLTFVVSPQIASLGDWAEQLIAESTGKSGTGILPVTREPLAEPSVYGDDRLFVQIHLEEDDSPEQELEALEQAGHPVARFWLRDPYELGGQMFLWEMATIIAGYRLGINPFNQPSVEIAKARAREMVSAYKETGKLPSESSVLSVPGITLYGDIEMHDLAHALRNFLSQASPGDYVALQAFVKPTTKATARLQEIRLRLRDRYGLTTTFGYGPRFLHSTGQLHKGDAGNGLFIQFTTNYPNDAPIPDKAGRPDSSITFGVLILAQALGDRQALRDLGRRVIRLHLEQEPEDGLLQVLDALD